jgi:hypothetical protein
VLATLGEKLAIILLAKAGSLLPGGGLWLHTQRPEWNDANNALVGNGLSVVTLAHLRRLLAFCWTNRRPARLQTDAATLTALQGLLRAAGAHRPAAAVDDAVARRRFLDSAGRPARWLARRSLRGPGPHPAARRAPAGLLTDLAAPPAAPGRRHAAALPAR